MFSVILKWAPRRHRQRLAARAADIHSRGGVLPPTGSTAGSALVSPTPPQGGSDPGDDAFLGARASRPHKAWHSLGHLPHLGRPGTAPWISFGLAVAVTAAVVAACKVALRVRGYQRNRMRAGRPRSQANHSPLEGESQKPSRQAKADAVGGGEPAAVDVSRAQADGTRQFFPRAA